MPAQAVPPPKDLGEGYCLNHRIRFKGDDCPACLQERMPSPAASQGPRMPPPADASEAERARRAAEAEAARARQTEAARQQQERFRRERDAEAPQLRGTTGGALGDLKGLAEVGASRPMGPAHDPDSPLRHGGPPTTAPAPAAVAARVPRDGASLMAQVPAFQNSPAADRITKGFQAVLHHDWPVALAWWQEAQQRDPDNGPLRRSVELAQWMVRQPRPQRPATALGRAIQRLSRSDPAAAVRECERAKAECPTLASRLDAAVAFLKGQSSTRAARQQGIMAAREALIDCLLDAAMDRLSGGHEAEAQAAFRDADVLAMGLKPPALGRPVPGAGPATAPRRKPSHQPSRQPTPPPAVDELAMTGKG